MCEPTVRATAGMILRAMMLSKKRPAPQVAQRLTPFIRVPEVEHFRNAGQISRDWVGEGEAGGRRAGL